MSADVELSDVSVTFGSFYAAKNVNVKVNGGEFFSFLGPSGCGKTTLLRAISGFQEPSEGKVLIDNKDMSGIGPNKRPIEIQIRTMPMHEFAERGVASHWKYKSSEKFNSLTWKEYDWLKDLVEIIEKNENPEHSYEYTKLQMFQENVFCFTPKGSVIKLPKNATPIDFAYAVHTKIGNTAIGCEINGNKSELQTILRNGDTVNIITSTIKNALSIPIQALTSRPENYKDQKKDNNDEKKWEESDESVSFKKVKPVDVVFVLKDNFEGNKAEDNQKYALVKEISVGISGENYYEVKSGLLKGEMIVIGGYRALSKELSHGDLVMLKNQGL